MSNMVLLREQCDRLKAERDELRAVAAERDRLAAEVLALRPLRQERDAVARDVARLTETLRPDRGPSILSMDFAHSLGPAWSAAVLEHDRPDVMAAQHVLGPVLVVERPNGGYGTCSVTFPDGETILRGNIKGAMVEVFRYASMFGFEPESHVAWKRAGGDS